MQTNKKAPIARKPTPVKRTRQKPEVRREQLSDAAARMIVKQGYLPLPIEQLTQNSGMSKALFYTYFDDQYALFNHLLERELKGLLASGLDVASQVQDLDQAALLSGSLYFEHVARFGPLLHILIADRYMAGHIDRHVIKMRNTALVRLARTARQTLDLSKAEILAAIEMAIAIPEESGRLVYTKEMDINVGRRLCRTLIASSIRALRSPDTILSGLVRAYDVA